VNGLDIAEKIVSLIADLPTAASVVFTPIQLAEDIVDGHSHSALRISLRGHLARVGAESIAVHDVARLNEWAIPRHSARSSGANTDSGFSLLESPILPKSGDGGKSTCQTRDESLEDSANLSQSGMVASKSWRLLWSNSQLIAENVKTRD
jgi:hypothetical protein